MLESDLHLNRMLQKHFQLKDNVKIDYDRFDHLVRKIVDLSNAFTGRETIPGISLEQARLLREHEWPTGGSKISKRGAKSQMLKDILGKGKKSNVATPWMSPFGSHFQNPQIESSYSFYLNVRSPKSRRKTSTCALVRSIFMSSSFVAFVF